MRDLRDYVQAPNGPRLQASAIDTIFAAALSKFASIILASLIKGDYEFLSAALITILYYAFPLTVNGQTLGKKIYGLRVLPSEGDQAIKWKEALIRETIGKGLAYITLLLGFFMILWRDDRRGLHDLMAKTIVVQDAAVAERHKGFFAGLAKSLVVSGFITLSSLTYFYYSSFIADRLEAQLTAQGLKVADVSGSLANGFRIAGFEVTNETDQINFGTIEFAFSDFIKIFTEKTLTISSVRFTNAELKVQNGSSEALLLGLLAIPFMNNEESGNEASARPPKFEKIVLKTLIAHDTKLTDPDKTTEIKLIQLTDLSVDPRTKDVIWSSLKVQSAIADLDTKQVEIKRGEIQMKSPLTAKLYRIPTIKILKPIDLIAVFTYSKGQLENLQINALDNKLTVTAQAGKNYQVWVNSLAPSEYFENLPFDKLSFYSSKASPFELLTGSPQTASFEIGSANFIYQNQPQAMIDPQSIFAAMLSGRLEATYQSGDILYVLKLPPGFISTLVMGSGKLELSSSSNLSPEDILYRLGSKNTQAISKFFVSPARYPAQQ